MPVRPRRQRRLTFEWSPRMALALLIGPVPGDPLPTDARMSETWEAFGRGYLLADCPAGSRPWAWWRFEDNIPGPLRETRPALYAIDDAERVEAEHAELEARRAAWLAEHEAA